MVFPDSFVMSICGGLAKAGGAGMKLPKRFTAASTRPQPVSGNIFTIWPGDGAKMQACLTEMARVSLFVIQPDTSAFNAAANESGAISSPSGQVAAPHKMLT